MRGWGWWLSELNEKRLRTKQARLVRDGPREREH